MEIRPGVGEAASRRPELRVGVDHRELDLGIRRAKVDEQLVDGVEHLPGPGVGAVDLVDAHDHRQVPGHRLGEDVAGLWQRALGRVHEQEDGVHHQQAALHLAPEVRVPGGVDDVEVDPAMLDRRLLGEDGDPLFTLKIPGVKDPIHHGLVGPEGTGLAQQGVDQRRLAVVDMRHDRQVAQVRARGDGCDDRQNGTNWIMHGPADCPMSLTRSR